MRELLQLANQIKHGTLIKKDVAVTAQTLKKEEGVSVQLKHLLRKRKQSL